LIPLCNKEGTARTDFHALLVELEIPERRKIVANRPKVTNLATLSKMKKKIEI
jgi:hypothetical protein